MNDRDIAGGSEPLPTETKTPGWGYHPIAPIVPAEPQESEDADDSVDEHGSHVDLTHREDGEREYVAEQETGEDDTDAEGEEGAIQVISLATGEPVPAAELAEMDKNLGEIGLGEYDWADYVAAKTALGEVRPEDVQPIQSFVEAALGSRHDWVGPTASEQPLCRSPVSLDSATLPRGGSFSRALSGPVSAMDTSAKRVEEGVPRHSGTSVVGPSEMPTSPQRAATCMPSQTARAGRAR